MRRLLLLVSVFLAGASGLGLEILLLSSAGLALGYGRSTALGLALFIAGWAVGAHAAGRSRVENGRAVLILGAALCLGSAPALRTMLWAGGSAPGSWFAEVSTCALIGVVAALQGAFLPLLARAAERLDASRRDLSTLLACSFAGSVLGAYGIGQFAVGLYGRTGAALVAGGTAGVAGILAACALRGRATLARETRAARDVPQSPRAEPSNNVAQAQHAQETQPAQQAQQAEQAQHAQRAQQAQHEQQGQHAEQRQHGGQAQEARHVLHAQMPHATGEWSLARAGWIVGWTTAWVAGLEWIGLRLGVLWLSGMQPALTAVVCAALLALALGALVLPRLVANSARGIIAMISVCAVGAIWPVIAAHGMHLLGRSVPAMRSSASEDPRSWQDALQQVPEFVRALVLVGPSLCALGAIVPVLHRLLPRSSGPSGDVLGRLYLHEAWGALIGVPVVHFILVPELGLSGATGALMASGALALLATYSRAPRATAAAFFAVILLALWASAQPDPALDSPPLSNPAFSLKSFRHDRDFAVAVVDDGQSGERTLLTDGFRAAGTGDEYRYMKMLGHLPILLHARPRRAAVLALGTGTTLGAVALHPEVEHIDVLEISSAVVEAAPWFEVKNRGVLAGASNPPNPTETSPRRVRVYLGDGRHTLAEHPGEYDVITMEPLLPDSPFAVYLYTREFYDCARRALAPGGLVCQWVPPHALEPESFKAVLDAFRSSFEWSSVWLFGTQVILLGGDREPLLEPGRFAALDRDLETALGELGIATPAGLLARFVSRSSSDGDPSMRSNGGAPTKADAASGRRHAAREPDAGTRWLTDDDPWIAYRARRTGTVLLGDLPANLRWLRERESDPPESWLRAAGPTGLALLQGVRTLHAAREAHAREEARLRGADLVSVPGDPDLAVVLNEARSRCAKDPELQDLEREIAFLGALRRGIAALSADRSRAGAEAALPDLLQATELSRQRADVHLYMAAALSRLASPAAEKALEAALTRCPRAAETVEGRRAHQLGLTEDLWRRAELSDRAAASQGR